MAIISKHFEGKIVLYDRYDSPFIFCKVKAPDSVWHRKSTQKNTIAEALAVAEEWYMELRFLHSRGMSTQRRTFSAVADLYLKELQEEVELGFKKERNFKDYKAIIQTYFRPFFGKKHIDLIKVKDISDYHKWRADYHINGPGSKNDKITYQLNGKKVQRRKNKRGLPSYTTRNTETVVLRAIFNTALKHEFITPQQMPPLTNPSQQTKDKNQRPAFTLEEYDQLVQFLHEWSQQENCRDKEKRKLLKNYVVFMIHTGLRPGKETDQLCWKHLRLKKLEDGAYRYVLTIPKDTKTGYRYPVANETATTALTQIKVDLVAGGLSVTDDTPVFCLPDGTHVKHTSIRRTFERALKECDLLHDAKGAKRSPYSLRHTYATFQLLYNKTSIYTLSKQMGCSIKMIQEHYGKLTPEMAIEELTDKSADNFL